MTRDASLVDDFSGGFYFREDDVCTVLVGGEGMRSLETARLGTSRAKRGLPEGPPLLSKK